MDPLRIRSLVIVLAVALQRIDNPFLVVVEGRELGVHSGHEGVHLHRVGVEDLLIDCPGRALDAPPLPVVLAHELTGVIVRPLTDVVAACVEKVSHCGITSHEGVERPAGVAFQVFEKGLVVLDDIDRRTDPSFEEVIEIARLEDAFSEIPGSGRQDGSAFSVKLVQVLLQVFLREIASDVREPVQDRFEINSSKGREAEDLCDLLFDLEEHHVSERKGTVRDDRLELHAESLRLIAHLHQVRAPVEGIVRTPYHHARDGPYLRHDAGCHEVVDSPVVPIFGSALPDAEIRECPSLEVLG